MDSNPRYYAELSNWRYGKQQIKLGANFIGDTYEEDK